MSSRTPNVRGSLPYSTCIGEKPDVQGRSFSAVVASDSMSSGCNLGDSSCILLRIDFSVCIWRSTMPFWYDEYRAMQLDNMLCFVNVLENISLRATEDSPSDKSSRGWPEKRAHDV